jgi:hypothetical protein
MFPEKNYVYDLQPCFFYSHPIDNILTGNIYIFNSLVQGKLRDISSCIQSYSVQYVGRPIAVIEGGLKSVAADNGKMLPIG